MKIPVDVRLPHSDDISQLRQRLTVLFRDIATQINLVSEGSLRGSYNAQTAVPTTGTYSVGDFIRNSAPSELGVAGSKYLIIGWTCVTAGSPGTWVQNRTLTGN